MQKMKQLKQSDLFFMYQLENEIAKNGTKSPLVYEAVDKIYKDKKYDLALQVAMRFNFKDASLVQKLSDTVIESKNPELNYLFAMNVKKCPIDKHINVVIQSKNPKFSYLLAQSKKIDKNQSDELINVIKDSKSSAYLKLLTIGSKSKKQSKDNNL